MNNQKSLNTLTQIKNHVQQKNRRKYCNSRQQKTLNFYQLYRDQIIKIQRWYRSRMADINRKNQTLLNAKLQKNQHLQQLKQQITDQLMIVSQRRAFLMEDKENIVLLNLESQIEVKLRRAVSGTLQRTQESALSNGKIKYVLEEIKNLRESCEQTEGEVEALRFEYDCYLRRKEQWHQKLKNIRNSILNQTLKTKEIKNKITEIQTHLMPQQHRNVIQN